MRTSILQAAAGALSAGSGLCVVHGVQVGDQGRSSYADIARQLNSGGYRTAFGRQFTTQNLGYICRRDGLMSTNRGGERKDGKLFAVPPLRKS
jgi:hypothetical protein